MRPKLLTTLTVSALLVALAACGGERARPAAADDLAVFEQELRAAGMYSGGKWSLFEWTNAFWLVSMLRTWFKMH